MGIDYEVPTAKIVFGVIISYVGYSFTTESLYMVPTLGAIIVVIVGLSLATHGLFTGIESAVAAGSK